MQSFTTSSGKEIKFDQRYVDFFKECSDSLILPKTAFKEYVIASTNQAGGPDKIDYAEVNEELREERKSLTLRGYASRFSRVYQFIKLLRRTGLPSRFDKHLDIGCGYGIQPRIMKALGITGHSTGIDIYDRCSAIDENNLKVQHKRLR